MTIAEWMDEVGEWDAVREKVIGENLLQMRTLNASQRIYREIASRLKLLTPAELELLREGSYQEQLYLLWLAVCKRYRFIYDFALELVRENYLRLEFDLLTPRLIEVIGQDEPAHLAIFPISELAVKEWAS